MTAPVLSPDASRCPDCRSRLTGPGFCSTCGIALTGPAAERLWEVDVALLQLEAERATLLRQLRAGTGGAGGGVVPAPGPPPVPARAEWTPVRVQNALLALGGLLLGVAALVFAAVTYDRLGAGGRAVVLLLLTIAAGLAVPVVRRRGLLSTAETLAGVTLLLGALDAYGLRTLGVGGDLSDDAYTAVSAAVLALLASVGARLVPVRTARAAAVLLAQLPVPLLLADAQAAEATAGLALTALAAADLLLLALLRRRLPSDVRALTEVCAYSVTGFAFMLGAFAAFLKEGPGAGCLVLLAVAALLVAAATLPHDAVQRGVLLGLPVPVLALAVTAFVRAEVTWEQLPLVPALFALAAVLAVQLAPPGLRPGPALGAAAVAVVGLAAVAEPALTGLLAPFGWVVDPWTAPPGSSARSALSPFGGGRATLAVPAVLAVAAATSAGVGRSLGRLRQLVPVTAALAAAAVALLPVGLDLDLRVGLGLLVAVGAAALLTPLPAGGPALPARIGGAAALLLAAAWSLADQASTLVVLPLAAAAMAGLALRVPRAAGLPAALAAGLLAAEVAALGAAAELAADQVGALLAAAAGALLAVAVPRLGAERRIGVECTVAATAVVAVTLAATDPGWLSWTVAGLGLVALAGALRPDRRMLAVAGGLLLAASSWVRLAEAGIEHPEPYVVPLALVALALGHLRRRAVPATGSFAAYGAGLSALLVPSLIAALAGGPLWRPLVLAGVALVVVLVGARSRLQAPLLIGGAVLAVDALRLLGPYAAALPRWLVLAGAGALLLGVGATYEQRLRELAGLQSRYAALG